MKALEHFALRRDRWEFYRSFSSPQLNLTVRFACADFVSACKKAGAPVFLYFLHKLCRATLACAPFRLRWNGNEVVEIGGLHPSFAVNGANGQLNFAVFEFSDDWETFLRRAQEAKRLAEAAPLLQIDAPGVHDYLFCTCLPWFDFTSIQHPADTKQNHTIPSFALGRIQKKGELLEMPLSIQVHHGLMDGVHVRDFLERLRRELDDGASGLIRL